MQDKEKNTALLNLSHLFRLYTRLYSDYQPPLPPSHPPFPSVIQTQIVLTTARFAQHFHSSVSHSQYPYSVNVLRALLLPGPNSGSLNWLEWKLKCCRNKRCRYAVYGWYAVNTHGGTGVAWMWAFR